MARSLSDLQADLATLNAQIAEREAAGFIESYNQDGLIVRLTPMSDLYARRRELQKEVDAASGTGAASIILGRLRPQ